MKSVDIFLALVALPGRVRNRLFNLVFSKLRGVEVRIVWSDVKIIGASRMEFGNRFFAGRGLWLEAVEERSRLVIGNNVNVSDWVHIGALDRVQIGDGCLLGSKVIITDHSHGMVDDIAASMPPVRPDARPLRSKGPVVLQSNVWLGDAVAVLSGVTIGSGAIIGANSVVTHDIPSNTVWAGVPAIQIWPKFP